MPHAWHRCLVLVPTAECPPAAETLPPCDSQMPYHALCEGDGECATDARADNCPGGSDVYQRVPCLQEAS